MATKKRRKNTPAKRKRAIFGRRFAFPECQDPSEVFNLIPRAVRYVPMPFRLTPTQAVKNWCCTAAAAAS